MEEGKLIRLDFIKRRKKGDIRILFIDLAMVLVAIVNLLFIIFDWHWDFVAVQNLFEKYWNGFYQLYHYDIHPNFLFYDFYFVVLFIIELIVRWITAVKRKTYHRWFWYPFIHWYDVLGCIPLGSFRFLRLFRIISIVISLQKLEVIDFRRSYFYAQYIKYHDIFVEEVSDRVVLNILTSWQESAKEGGPVLDRIVNEVLQPKKEVLVEWASHRLKMVAGKSYDGRREELRDNITHFVTETLDNNPDVQDLKKLPIVGKMITSRLQTAISKVTFNVINEAMAGLSSDNNKVIIGEVADMIFDSVLMEEKDKSLDKITKSILVESIEIMKEEASVKQWKLREEREEQMRRKKNWFQFPEDWEKG